MKSIHIVGKRNHGKTTLVCELIPALRAKGLKVGTVKHSSHAHSLDKPGKDSYRHREAGSEPAAIVTPEQIAVFTARADGDPLQFLAKFYEDCDLVLIEGFIEGKGPKAEVWRREKGEAPLAATRSDIAFVISDDSPDVSVPVVARAQVDDVAEQIKTILDLH